MCSFSPSYITSTRSCFLFLKACGCGEGERKLTSSTRAVAAFVSFKKKKVIYNWLSECGYERSVIKTILFLTALTQKGLYAHVSARDNLQTPISFSNGVCIRNRWAHKRDKRPTIKIPAVVSSSRLASGSFFFPTIGTQGRSKMPIVEERRKP